MSFHFGQPDHSHKEVCPWKEMHLNLNEEQMDARVLCITTDLIYGCYTVDARDPLYINYEKSIFNARAKAALLLASAAEQQK